MTQSTIEEVNINLNFLYCLLTQVDLRQFN